MARASRIARVLLTQPIPEGPLARLRSVADVHMFPDSSRIMSAEEIIAALGSSEVLYCLLQNRIDARVIEAGRNLRLIADCAIVPGNVEVAAATSRGIVVTVIPNIVAESTADLQWGLLLAIGRRIVEADRALRKGMFPGSQSLQFAGGEVSGRTLGTIGLGAIGAGIARRARGFNMRVLYTKRTRLSAAEEAALSIQYRELDDLLRESDFVVINASLHAGTTHLIGARELALMKSTAYLVNTARGAIVDEQALVDALRSRRIAGAGLDVFEHEPTVHRDLFRLENVVLTPHLGSITVPTLERIASAVVDNILAFLRGDRPPNIYNPEVVG
jgi:glyoxylate reductase